MTEFAAFNEWTSDLSSRAIRQDDPCSGPYTFTRESDLLVANAQ